VRGDRTGGGKGSSQGIQRRDELLFLTGEVRVQLGGEPPQARVKLLGVASQAVRVADRADRADLAVRGGGAGGGAGGMVSAVSAGTVPMAAAPRAAMWSGMVW
jgi:hypothetical protein